MALKNPVMFYVLAFFILINLADTITGTMILPGEANPIYLLTGSFIAVIVWKVVIIGLAMFYYHRNIYPSHFAYFLILLALTMGNLLIGIGVYSNIIGIMNPELIEVAAAIPTAEKARAYAGIATIFYMLPMGLALLAFHFYEKSLGKIKVDKEYYKKKKWYQI